MPVVFFPDTAIIDDKSGQAGRIYIQLMKPIASNPASGQLGTEIRTAISSSETRRELDHMFFFGYDKARQISSANYQKDLQQVATKGSQNKNY